ncbi:MAG TPA: DUF2231 domain-containing protein [Ardenticatenaceae bacterium]|jgi:uncharacterized membrane protein
MESKAQLAGHALHPLLIVFPLGLLTTGVIFDVAYLVTNDATFATVAYWMILAGIIGGVVASIFGFWDWAAIPNGTSAKSVGQWHGIGNAVVLVLFLLSWFLRSNTEDYIPSAFALVASFLGVGVSVVTGWLGGELVERLGVGVDRGAHLDAPSSLSNEPIVIADTKPQRSTPPPRRNKRR